MSDESVPLQEVEDVILELIKEFVGRLGIVQEAVFHLHPFIMWKTWNKKKSRTPQEKATFMKKTHNMPWSGIWKNIWTFRVRPLGCELRHIHNGEPLRWDVGERNGFDKYWFIHWLEWRLKNKEVNISVLYMKKNIEVTNITDLERLVFPVLERLCSTHKLTKPNSSFYILN